MISKKNNGLEEAVVKYRAKKKRTYLSIAAAILSLSIGATFIVGNDVEDVANANTTETQQEKTKEEKVVNEEAKAEIVEENVTLNKKVFKKIALDKEIVFIDNGKGKTSTVTFGNTYVSNGTPVELIQKNSDGTSIIKLNNKEFPIDSSLLKKEETTSFIYNENGFFKFFDGKNVITIGDAWYSLKDDKKMVSADVSDIAGKELYFRYLPLNTKTNYTGDDFDRYLKHVAPDSPLIGLGHVFVEAANEYQINALYLLSHAIHESNYGKSDIAKDKYNLFGMKAVDSNAYANAQVFESFEEGIYFCAAYIKENYLSKSNFRYNGSYLGGKASGMNVKYASDSLWGLKIAAYMSKIDSYLGKKDFKKVSYGKSNVVYKDKTTIVNIDNENAIYSVQDNDGEFYKVLSEFNEVFYIKQSDFKSISTF